MGKIEYQKTYFSPPPRINESDFFALKKELNQNPNFIIDKGLKTFSEHFKSKLTTIGISIGLFILGLIITGDNTGSSVSIWNPIMGISIIVVIFTIISLLLAGPSYATYVKKRKDYFDRMTYAITISNSYSEYIENFYGQK